MDPLNALSVASSVVQFVDFGRQLLSASYEIYRSPSGESSKNVDLRTISKDLTDLVAQIKKKVGPSANIKLDKSTAEYRLAEISKECEMILKEFEGALDKLGRQRSSKKTAFEMARGAILTALEDVLNASTVDRMRARLDNQKCRLVDATLFCLWEESKRSVYRDDQFKKQLDNMITILGRLDDRADKLSQETTHKALKIDSGSDVVSQPANSIDKIVTDGLHDRESLEDTRLYKQLVDSLWINRLTSVPQSRKEWDPASDGGEISTMFRGLYCNAILQSLAFETIQGREEAIPQAFKETFSWIYLREPTELDGLRLWSSFPEWLEGNMSQPYWITGKPGSGKSTLMKFLQQQPLLITHLKNWSGELPLICTSYYAWVAGSDLQKSCQGLMRTLLYRILTENPSWIPEIAPRRWLLSLTLRDINYLPSWYDWEMEESFETLLVKCGISTRLALFIDGLDEFDSPPFKVLELIQKINSRDCIKICVASRQWTEFNDAFHQSPMLRMQDLTAADLAHFVDAKLEGNRGFLERKRIFPMEAIQLVADVVAKAQGVFLWVSIVVRSLLDALTEGDGLSDLRTIVDQLPSDIALLYDAIWARIGSRNIIASAKLLVTFKAAKGPLSYMILWLADERQPLDFDIRTLSAEGRIGVREIVERRLDSRTRGILEISTGGNVDFLHRTARDWMLQPRIWEGISSQVPGDFDPYLQLLRAETLSMSETCAALPSGQWPNVKRVLWYASQVKQSPTADPELVLLLKKFDQEVYQAVRSASEPENDGTSKNKLTEHGDWNWMSVPVDADKHQHTFLGLMARYCVLPYLRANMPNDPNRTPSKMCISLLENAVFGYADTEYHIEWKQRIATVALLLDNGVSRKQIFVNGTSAIKEVRSWKEVTTSGDRKYYFTKVEELLSLKRSFKESLKTGFERVKGR
ncbi:hypothetical protein NA56DRAFT_324899 [Hyaloscypha hepaticicola]|uniref:Uncharacterized protein n=1 Tax=Hyaloscypha hepaticicola TaxID=2082293 RepID=A0A2J6PPN0_9HELO|nr:hypothetical protein NA56DRAFT_324899 [Hyaloscypha hepaticicola]